MTSNTDIHSVVPVWCMMLAQPYESAYTRDAHVAVLAESCDVTKVRIASTKEEQRKRHELIGRDEERDSIWQPRHRRRPRLDAIRLVHQSTSIHHRQTVLSSHVWSPLPADARLCSADLISLARCRLNRRTVIQQYSRCLLTTRHEAAEKRFAQKVKSISRQAPRQYS